MPSRRSSYPDFPVEPPRQAATVTWANGIVPHPECSGEWTSCAATNPNFPLSGSFPVYSQASSIVVYGWKVNGSQATVALDRRASNDLVTQWQSSEDEMNMFKRVLSTFLPPPGTLDLAWVQFSVTFPPLSNGGKPTQLVLTGGSVPNLSDEDGFRDPTLIFQNVTIFYAPIGSGPTQTVRNGTANPTLVPGQPAQASTELATPSSIASQVSAPGRGGHRSSAAVIVPAVVVPVVAVAVVACAMIWWLRYKRRLAPSAAFKANPETAWVPIDEKRQPTPGPSI